MLLVLGASGGASAGQLASQQPQAAPPAPAVDAAEQRRVEAAYLRTDRRYRQAAEEAVEQAQAEAQTRTELGGRAEEPDVKPPPPPPPPAPAESSESDSGGGSPGEPVGPIPDSCDEYSGNRAVGCTLLLDAGFSLDQMSCLDNLWSNESGWNERASNPSSGAHGIPQALPGDKMASHGDDWRTNPATQIRWGLSYIDNRYGTPCGAWGHFQSNNWY